MGYYSARTVHSADDKFSIAFGAAAVAVKTGYVLIDLSDTTHYPHTLTGEIHVDYLSICLHGDNAAIGTVQIGFITEVDATDGSMYSISCIPIDKIEDIINVHRNFHPSAIICKTENHLAGGGALVAADVIFQTDVALTGTYGTPNPAVGDLVMLVNPSAGTFENVGVTVGYHTET